MLNFVDSPNYLTGRVSSQVGVGLDYSSLVTSRLTASAGEGSRVRTRERMLDLSWLKACSKEYKVSSDPNDYSYGIVRSLVVDLPNRNGHGFSLKELLTFLTRYGMQSFKTFEGKPLLLNHDYSDITNALGIIVSSTLVQDGPYIVDELVVGVDRNKHSDGASLIDSGGAEFSMGAVAEKMECSICGALFDIAEPDKHCTPAAIQRPTGEKKELSYMKVIAPYFIENSLLIGQKPADPRALHSSRSI